MREWFDAARDGNDERVAELLAQQPGLIALQDRSGYDQTALHYAALGGHEKIVARLLAARSDLVEIRNFAGWTALDVAVSSKNHRIILMLADSTTNGTMKGFCHALSCSHFDVMDLLLLNAKPGSISATDRYALQAFFGVIQFGREKFFAKLLAACPDLIDATSGGMNALQYAAKMGREQLVTRILALRPQMIDVVDYEGWNALAYAVSGGVHNTVWTVLAAKPDAIFHIANTGGTILHDAVMRFDDVQFLAKLWRLNPQALTHADNKSHTPFYYAVLHEKDEVMEMFQWSLSFDDIMTAFKQQDELGSMEEKYRPLMEQQCALLFQSFLNQDVAGTVFEYLGFAAPIKRGGDHSTQQEHAPEVEVALSDDHAELHDKPNRRNRKLEGLDFMTRRERGFGPLW